MNTTMKIIFWVSSFLIIYPYFLYPIVLFVLSIVRAREARGGEGNMNKKVTLIISAYNEEESIADKIENSLSLDYPRELLEIMVVSDGSTDGTDSVVGEYAGRGVILKRYEGRLGKTLCLNRAVKAAKGEIIILTDANSMLDKGAAANIVREFVNDERIGLVTGGTRYISDDDGTESVGFYSRLEKLIKGLESKTGSCVGADGALFAVRKSLYTPLGRRDINDLVIPFTVIIAGYRCVYSPKVFCFEKTAGSARGEFNRQIRITTRTIRAVISNASLLNGMRFGEFSFKLISHKFLRLIVPLFMIAALITNILTALDGPLYMLALICQIAFYGLALIKQMGLEPGRFSGAFSIPHTFISVNIAILKGWVKYFSGEAFVTWQPTR